MTDEIAATEITRQIAALKPRLVGPRGVMSYLDKHQGDQRADVNKTFLTSVIRSVDSHNRRHEEDKCWTLREMEQKLRKNTERRRRGRDKRRMETHGRSIRKRHCRSRSRSRHTSTSRSRRRSRSSDRSIAAREQIETKDEEEERSYWARKKADRTRELWKNLYAEGTVSVENGPDYSSDDEDIRPPKVRCAIEENTHKRQDT